MKILVCISKTPDTTAKIAFTDNNTKLAQEGIQWILNPYDEWYALVRALEWKEKNPDTSIHLISVGGPDYDPIIRKAFALGGDEAIRIQCEPTDSLQVASLIAEAIKETSYDLIFTGKETLDFNSASVGPMLAELLDWPFIGFATRLEDLGDGKIKVKKETEGGEETLEATFPLVISCQKGMAEQRIPNMKGIMSARTKPLKVLESSAFEPLVAINGFVTPPAKTGVKLVPADRPEELVRLLHEEAKVI